MEKARASLETHGQALQEAQRPPTQRDPSCFSGDALEMRTKLLNNSPSPATAIATMPPASQKGRQENATSSSAYIP